jgi:trehalose/maltose transport system permease protein
MAWGIPPHAMLLEVIMATRTNSDALSRSRARTAWVLLAPTIIVTLLVAAYPLYRTIYFSLTDASYLRPNQEQFIGFNNYIALFADQTWWTSVKNTLVFGVSSVLLEFVLGLMVALILHSQFRGRGMVRAAILIPWAIPTVVSSQMWAWMYNDVIGVINDIFLRLGIIAKPVGWLADPALALPAIIAVDVWKTTPFVALLLLAALQTIPSDIYEAAKVDGASPVRQFFSLTLPLLVPSILVTLIFRTLDSLRVFDVIQVMKAADISTISMSVYNRQQLVDFNKLGYGSSISIMIFLVIGVFTVIYITSSRVKFD